MVEGLRIEKKEDLLRCVRNELVPGNKKVLNYGLKGLLEYRINAGTDENHVHPDSLYAGWNRKDGYYGRSVTAACFERIYRRNPFQEGSSDTIFNCWSYAGRFLRGIRRKKQIELKIDEKEVCLEEYAFAHLEEMFEGYDATREKLDRLAEYHHSLANLMPAPCGFNGSFGHDGKGNFLRDNDMPDVYYRRAKQDFPQMYRWIQENMDSLCLQFFQEYESYLKDKEAKRPVSVDNKEEVQQFEKSVENAILCIEERGERLFRKMSASEGK